MTVRLALVLAGILAFASQPAGAQDSLRVGDHVRVTLHAGPPPLTGHLIELDTTALGIRLDEASIAGDSIAALRLARESIAGLEVGRKHGHAGRGAWMGALLGGVVAFVGFAVDDDDDYHGETIPTGHALLISAPFGGALIGALVGASIEHERWEPAPLPPASPGEPRR